ncbi:MAG: TldD/PmbA family protein [Candidatus Methanospirareceae archaeon]
MEISERIMREAKRMGIHCEAYVEHTKTMSFSGDTHKIVDARSEISGIGIRVVRGKRLLNLCFSPIDEGVIGKMKDFIGKDMGAYVETPPFTYTDMVSHVEGLYDAKGLIEVEEGIEICKDVIDIVKSYDKRIKTVRCHLTSSLRCINVKNTFGIDKSLKSTYYSLLVNCAAGKAQGHSHVVLRKYRGIKEEEIAIEAAEMAIKTMNKRRIRGGRMDVILHPRAAAVIFSSLVPSICADTAGSLPLKKRVGMRISNEKLTIYDDATAPGLVHSRPFDDEGWPTQFNMIIEHGVFKGFLYDNYSANLRGVLSTGNAFRPSYSSRIIVSPHNLIITGGDFKEEEMIKEVKDGVFIPFLLGSNTNPVTGDVSATAFNSFRIEKGEITYPLQDFFIGINMQEFMQKASMMTKESIEVPGNSYSIKAPFFLIKDVFLTSTF